MVDETTQVKLYCQNDDYCNLCIYVKDFKMNINTYFPLLVLSLSWGTHIKSATGDILILPIPIFSALYKSACLARELKQHGYNVTVVLPDGPAKKTLLEEFDFDFIVSEGMTNTLETVIDAVTNVVIPSAFSGSQMGMISLLTKCGLMCYTIGNDEKLLKALQQRNFKIAVINMAFINLCASVIPYKLGIPFIREAAVPLESRILIHPAVFPVNVFLPSTDEMTFFQRLGNTLYYAIYLLKPEWFNPSDVVGTFAPEKEHISNEELQARTELYLLDYDELAEHHLPLYPNMIPVGGLATRPPRPLTGELKEFMDSAHDGAVIVSFGSVINWIPREIHDKMVAAFSRFPHLKFVFKFGKETRIDGNLMFVSWIPQNDLLGHPNTKIFITHCGHNAQYDALYNAVPIIALPINSDQPYNAMTMQAKGFGIKLDIVHITENDLISAIDKILNNPLYKENILNASVIFKSRPFTPAQRAAWWIDHVIKYGGKHLRPPVAKLPYYQFLLLDVIVGMLLLFAILCLTCYSLCTCVFRMFRKIKHKKD